jgi:hypothetical protein
MMRVLRDNASHFHNFGKPNPFPTGFGWKTINEVSWEGLTVKRGQIGDTIDYQFGYALRLVQQCEKYLKNNEATLK